MKCAKNGYQIKSNILQNATFIKYYFTYLFFNRTYHFLTYQR